MSEASRTVAYKELDNKWLKIIKYGIGIGAAGFALFVVSLALPGAATSVSAGLFLFAAFCLVGGSVVVAFSIWEDKKFLDKKTGRATVNNPLALWIYVYFSLYTYSFYHLLKRRSKYQDTPTVSEGAQSNQDISVELETEPTRQNSEPTTSTQQGRGDDTVGGDDDGDSIFCVECGQELQADAKFCTSCGNNLP